MGRFADILSEVKQLKATQKLDDTRRTLTIQDVPQFTPPEIKAIRMHANMTQNVFAFVLGVSTKSIEAWEGGRSTPSGPARRLLSLLAENPHFAHDSGIIAGK